MVESRFFLGSCDIQAHFLSFMLHSLLLQVCMPFRMSVLTKAALILMGSSAGAGYDSQRGKRVKLSLRA